MKLGKKIKLSQSSFFFWNIVAKILRMTVSWIHRFELKRMKFDWRKFYKMMFCVMWWLLGYTKRYVASHEIKLIIPVNTLRPGQNGRHFPDDILKCIFLNEKVPISFEISLRFVRGLINNILALVQIMAWRLPGDKSLSEPMVVSLRIYASRGLNELII